jgi:hypothetical protein
MIYKSQIKTFVFWVAWKDRKHVLIQNDECMIYMEEQVLDGHLKIP